MLDHVSTAVSDMAAARLRPDCQQGCYAAILCDPDGNRVETVCHLLDEGPGVDGSG